MNDKLKSLLTRAYSEQGGQVLPFMALLMILFLGLAGLSLDLGQAYVSYRELQASTDAAALAGGYAMSNVNETVGQAQAAAAAYGSASTCSYGGCPGANVNANLPSATISVTLSCNSFVTTTVGVPCTQGPGADTNAIQVVQTAKVQTPFIHILNMLGVHTGSSLTLSATATASMLGSASSQYNIAVVVDSTGSMSSQDGGKNCNGSKEQCAMEGIQSLLSGLTPCSQGSTASDCKSAFDSVAIFAFPNLAANSAPYTTTCPVPKGKGPVTAPYSVPTIGGTSYAPSTSGSAPSYLLTGSSSNSTGFVDNYSSSNAQGGTLPTSSTLGILTGADSSNCGLVDPISGQGTYLAGAIYAAQASLVAAKAANPGSQNAMIVLTDGDANATTTFTDATGKTLTTKTGLNTNGTYPSMTDQCQQAVTAANYATTNKTSVYIVGYAAQTSGCSTDTKAYQDPCTNLKAMASSPGDFYADTSTCPGASVAALPAIFSSITAKLTNVRLIPN